MTTFRAYLRPYPSAPWQPLCQCAGNSDDHELRADCWTLARNTFEFLASRGRFVVTLASLCVLESPETPYGVGVRRKSDGKA